MTVDEAELPTVYLLSGEIHFTDRPAVVTTVLGSCVSVTLFNRRRGLSAICHGMLPHCRSGQTCGRTCAEAAKYVDCSLLAIISRFQQYGVVLSELEIGVYGGADMFGSLAGIKTSASVGKQNIEMALRILEREGALVHTMDVGGTEGRKMHFNTGTGEVRSVRLQPRVVLASNGNGGPK
jgi:chemotaxis protein CheD